MTFQTRLLATATALTAGLVAFQATPAKAAGCYPSLASSTIETALAGGATLQEAWTWAVHDGHATDTNRCWTMIKGYTRQMHNIKPYSVHAIFR